MNDVLLTGGTLYVSVALAIFLGVWTVLNFNFVTLFFALLVVIAVATTGDYDGTMFLNILNHPYIVIGSIIVYFGAGAVYSIFKWFLYIRSDENITLLKREFENYKDGMEQSQRIKISNDIVKNKFRPTEDEKAQIDAEMQNWVAPSIQEFKNCSRNFLVASKNKMRIINWIVWWPFSFVWTLTHDLIENIYKYLVNIYNKIANKQIDKILGD